MFRHDADMFGAHHFRDHEYADLFSHLRENVYALFSQPLKAMRASTRFVCPGTQDRYSDVFQKPGCLDDLLSAFNCAGAGDKKKGTLPSNPDMVSKFYGRIRGMEIPAHQFVSLCYMD